MAIYTKPKPAGTPTWGDLMAPDVEAARNFYQKVFGWEYEISGPEFGSYSIARSGPYMAAGIGGMPPDAPGMPSAWNLYFATEDIEADLAKAVQLGATVLNPVMEVGVFGSMATCSDPTGAVFSFWQAKQHIGAEVIAEPGAMAWYELYSTDAKQARDFYTALLGATADAMEGGLEYYVLKHGDEELAGIMQIDPSWGPMPSQWAIYFAVPDADKAVASVTEQGGTMLGPIDDSPFGRLAALTDPSGALFKIVEVPSS